MSLEAAEERVKQARARYNRAVAAEIRAGALCDECHHRRDEHCLEVGICKHDYPAGAGCELECLAFAEAAP